MIIDIGKRIKAPNEVKDVQHKNRQSFLEMSAVEKEVPLSHKLQVKKN